MVGFSSVFSGLKSSFQEILEIPDVLLERNTMWDLSLFKADFSGFRPRCVWIIDRDRSRGDMRSAFERAKKIAGSVSSSFRNAPDCSFASQDAKLQSIIQLQQTIKWAGLTPVEEPMSSKVKYIHPLAPYQMQCLRFASGLVSRNPAQITENLTAGSELVMKTFGLADQDIVWKPSVKTLFFELNPSEQELTKKGYLPRLDKALAVMHDRISKKLSKINQEQKLLLTNYAKFIRPQIQNWDDSQVLSRLAQYSDIDKDRQEVLKLVRMAYLYKRGADLGREPLSSQQEIYDMIASLKK